VDIGVPKVLYESFKQYKRSVDVNVSTISSQATDSDCKGCGPRLLQAPHSPAPSCICWRENKNFLCSMFVFAGRVSHLPPFSLRTAGHGNGRAALGRALRRATKQCLEVDDLRPSARNNFYRVDTHHIQPIVQKFPQERRVMGSIFAEQHRNWGVRKILFSCSRFARSDAGPKQFWMSGKLFGTYRSC
jgi:hypothetical protein